MGVTENLAVLRQAVRPLEGEVMIEGWAAERARGDERVCGLVLVSNWRFIFVDPREGLSAFPIFKIDYVERRSPTCLALSTWYDRMQLAFDNQAALGAALNLLRQDSRWAAAELDLARETAGAACEGRRTLSTITP
ncbi:MAG: hypothetical protein V4514_19485 [Pseudomonadota bacterium]|uniref:hypothetical protein n=1 Tax=unclassified Phenylobacterium TaxID=2640670 RepID=UPI0006FCA03B|nr:MULTISPECIES: hypothetical protein [unclassified Phenylobacterium]KRB52613.1 hypothetical protein ASE02_11550 [Phenylobacterium sp. Root700]MBT9471962.1 hypothetical protein [Phenylobacterium sp.]